MKDLLNDKGVKITYLVFKINLNWQNETSIPRFFYFVRWIFAHCNIKKENRKDENRFFLKLLFFLLKKGIPFYHTDHSQFSQPFGNPKTESLIYSLFLLLNQ